MAKKKKSKLSVETLTHPDAGRTNIPTAELQPVVPDEDQKPVAVHYDRGGEALGDEKAARNRDLDPQLVWRGKDEQDWSDLVVQAPPIYIQEKVHPKALIDDLVTQSERAKQDEETQAFGEQLDLFANFNGLPSPEAKTEFYRHEGHWSNRMILGDSLQVMASLAEREGLRGKVQCIYFDPPYGIKFNSNFQWSTTSRDVKDGNAGHITREPEQVKAFRDTWRDGIHSYLTYLRDRLTVARDLLTESGSVFIQIGDENVHRVRAVMDEVFGEQNFISLIAFRTTTGLGEKYLDASCNYIVWYARKKETLKYRGLFKSKTLADDIGARYRRVETAPLLRRAMTSGERNSENALPNGASVYRHDNLTSQSGNAKSAFPITWEGMVFQPGRNYWKTNLSGVGRLKVANRIANPSSNSISYVRFLDDYPVSTFSNVWTDTQTGAFTDEKTYVVQTNAKVVERCVLMATDPGDLVLDPTCGSGTTATVAEQWGRRWITVDTSRVALALARARIMGARYPYYLLADSGDGQQKEAQLAGRDWSPKTTHGNIRHGFVYERVPHITLKSIANNAEIDVLYEQHQPQVLDALAALNTALKGHKQPFKITTGGRQGKKLSFNAADSTTITMPSGEEAPANSLLEWEVPREAPEDWPKAAAKPLAAFWEARIARQQAIDASIAAKADSELLYDKPYEDTKKCRVAGPFTVESLSPHRVLGVDEDDELIDPQKVGDKSDGYGAVQTFDQMILDNLKTAGVQQAHKDDKIHFTSLTGWPGHYLCAEGRYQEGGTSGGNERRAGIFIGPEFGTISRPDLVEAAREAADAGFDCLIACAFSFGAHAGEFHQLGRVPVLKARMNADLHMADTLKNTGKGNLFVIFGEPDITITPVENDRFQVKVNGVDVFDPSTGEVRSDSADGIACWFIDTDYNGESFFVRHAYFLGQNDPYKALKTTLKAEIDPDAWATLNSDTSRPFRKPTTGRIAVKVINHLGDEVMKVFKVSP